MADFSNDTGLWTIRAIGTRAGAAMSPIYLLAREAAASVLQFTSIQIGSADRSTIVGSAVAIAVTIARLIAVCGRFSAASSSNEGMWLAILPHAGLAENHHPFICHSGGFG